MNWEVHHNGKVRRYTQKNVLAKLHSCEFSGVELAKAPGTDEWRPLHSTALYRQVVPAGGANISALRRRVLVPWFNHLGIFFVLLAVFWYQGLPTMFFPFWFIGVAAHGFSTVRKLLDLGSSAAPVSTVVAEPESELLSAIAALEQSGWTDDLAPLRDAARELASKRALAVEAADAQALQTLTNERDEVTAALASADTTTAAMLTDQLAAIEARVAFLQDVQRLATRLQARERTLLHQVEALRLGRMSQQSADGRVDLEDSVQRLRQELQADAEVSDALARARRAQRT